jgi:choline dehydrogenase
LLSENVIDITATKEVILSAGVFQTPQLLMLSGIGPQQTMQQFGIPAYHTNENIGRHMQDHCYFSVIARVRKEASASQLYSRIDLLQAAQKQYTANHTGPLTSPVGPTYGFQQIFATELTVLDTTGVLENRTNQAHIEYLWENFYYPSEPSTLLSQCPPNLNESFMSLTAAVLAPVSRGNISLQSNTISDAPVINVNYLESEVDQRIALYGFKTSAKTYLSQNSQISPSAPIMAKSCLA